MVVGRGCEKEVGRGRSYMQEQVTSIWPVATKTISGYVDILALRLREQVKVKSDGIWSPEPTRDFQWLSPCLAAVLKKHRQPKGRL